MEIKLGRRTVMVGAATTILVAGIGLAILAAGGIVAWEYSNSNAFCTNNCHAVHPGGAAVATPWLRMRASNASSATWVACRRCS